MVPPRDRSLSATHALQLPGGRSLPGDRLWIMGVLNVTPDSFSDGGRFLDPAAAVAQARRMLDEGADVIDIGGESTRPGAQRVAAEEQVRRIMPVVEQVTGELGAVVSVDTTQASVADAALRAGAAIVNDISAGREDPGMFELVADRGAAIVLMHMQGEPGTMQRDPQYGDVLAEVLAFLRERAAAAEAAGVARQGILLDPGLGFGKTFEHNLALLAGTPALVAAGYPVVIGASRKRFLRVLAGRSRGGVAAGEADAGDVVGATCAVTAWAVQAGAAMVRVHDVAANRQAAMVAQACRLYRS